MSGLRFPIKKIDVIHRAAETDAVAVTFLDVPIDVSSWHHSKR